MNTKVKKIATLTNEDLLYLSLAIGEMIEKELSPRKIKARSYSLERLAKLEHVENKIKNIKWERTRDFDTTMTIEVSH